MIGLQFQSRPLICSAFSLRGWLGARQTGDIMRSVKVRDNESFDIAMRTTPGLPGASFLERVSLWINDLDTHLKFANAQFLIFQ